MKDSPERHYKKSKHQPAGFIEQHFLQQNIFKEVEAVSPYTEHKMTINQLSDIYPLSRLDEKLPANCRGLNEDEALSRLASGEANLIRPWSTFRYRIQLFAAQFLNTFRFLLLMAALICLLIFALDRSRCDEIIMALILVTALIIMCLLSYFEKQKTMKQIRGFRSMVPVECTVVREGKERRISSNQLVRGDLIRIRVGDRVPADVRLIDTHDLRIEASWVVGMVEPLEYIHEPALPGMGVLDAQNVVFSGSSCTAGHGLGIVIRVGNKTLIGRLIDMIAKEHHERSCLESEHNRFVRFITIVSLAMATVTSLIGLYLSNFKQIVSVLVNGFLIVIVANVPQGLPITLTAQLLIVVRRLAKKCGGMTLKCVDTADTLGMTSVMMTNKTGVLTCGALRVTELWMAGRYFGAEELVKHSKNTTTEQPFFEENAEGKEPKSQKSYYDASRSNAIKSVPEESGSVTLSTTTENNNFVDIPLNSNNLKTEITSSGNNRTSNEIKSLPKIVVSEYVEDKPTHFNDSTKNDPNNAEENANNDANISSVLEDVLKKEENWALNEILNVMSVCSTAFVENAITSDSAVMPSNNNTIYNMNELENGLTTINDLTTRSMFVWPPSRASSFRRRQRRLALRSQSVCSMEFRQDDKSLANGKSSMTADAKHDKIHTILDVSALNNSSHDFNFSDVVNRNPDASEADFTLSDRATNRTRSNTVVGLPSIYVSTNKNKKYTDDCGVKLSNFSIKQTLLMQKIEQLNRRTKNSKNSSTNKNYKPHTVERTLVHQDLKEFPSNFQGLPIDVAMLKYVEMISSVQEIRKRYEFVHELPFSSNRRYHLTIVAERKKSTTANMVFKQNGNTEKFNNKLTLSSNTLSENCSEELDKIITYKLMIKGAPEELIRNCSTIVTENGGVEELNDDQLYGFEEAYLKFGEEGKTCIAFATLEFDAYADALFYSPSSSMTLGSTNTNEQPVVNGLFDALFSRFPESGWCFLGMVAMYDPPRPNVMETVQKLERAGIRLFMVTGDHPTTAEALAHQIGFTSKLPSLEPTTTVAHHHQHSDKNNGDLRNGSVANCNTEQKRSCANESTQNSESCASSGYSSANDIDPEKVSSTASDNSSETAWHDDERQVAIASSNLGELAPSELSVIHGDSLTVMSDSELDALLRRRRLIFARITPSQKFRLVKQCQKLRYVVTSTGDGLMDALALKQSDIGIASNSNGSIFAKEAADIVIAENDLSNLVRGIEEARLLYDNLKKTVAYTLSHLLPELLPVLLSFVLGLPLGLNSLQVLIIDLLTEIPPSVALIFEPPERDIMRRVPRKRSSHLVTPQLLFYAYAQAGLLISLGCAFAYFTVFWWHGMTLGNLCGTSNLFWHNNSPTLTIPNKNTCFSQFLMNKSGNSNLTEHWTESDKILRRHLNATQQMEIRAQANAAWHITLVVTQIFHSFICSTRRTSLFRHGIRNEKLAAAAIFEIIFLAALVFVPGLQNICGIRPPPALIWAFPVAIGFLLLIFNEARKYAIRKRPRSRIIRVFKW